MDADYHVIGIVKVNSGFSRNSPITHHTFQHHARRAQMYV